MIDQDFSQAGYWHYVSFYFHFRGISSYSVCLYLFCPPFRQLSFNTIIQQREAIFFVYFLSGEIISNTIFSRLLYCQSETPVYYDLFYNKSLVSLEVAIIQRLACLFEFHLEISFLMLEVISLEHFSKILNLSIDSKMYSIKRL